MQRNLSSVLRKVRAGALGLAMAAPLLAACPKGDVGAPCNHGRIEPPQSKLVTFPALSCNDLLCVYADDEETPSDNCTPGEAGNATCNSTDPSRNRFECVRVGDTDNGRCQLRIDYVLARSMCSKKCSSNDDCKDGGIGQDVVVEDTQCKTGFECARIQSLGEFCCQKLCVCKDDLGANDLDEKCSSNTQEGCCDQIPTPEGCGVP